MNGTLLAYVRTALGFFIVGVPAVWWLDQPYVQLLGAGSLAAGVSVPRLGSADFTP
jgi:putative membrane protein